MEGVKQFFDGLLSRLTAADFGLLAIIDLSAFAVTFAAALLFCIFSPAARGRDRKAFLCLVNAFTAVTLAVFLTAFALEQAVAFAAMFWFAGYLLYWLLRCIKGRGASLEQERVAPVQSTVSFSRGERAERGERVPAARTADAMRSDVRLDHAVSIADKLLVKNLGRGDRQELEKIKTALTVLKVKSALSPQEGENLNEMFNALLKLMAKYDL